MGLVLLAGIPSIEAIIRVSAQWSKRGCHSLQASFRGIVRWSMTDERKTLIKLVVSEGPSNPSMANNVSLRESCAHGVSIW
jgi:hypothetical protein